MSRPTDKDLRDALTRAYDMAAAPKLFGMTYEDGVRDALAWAAGDGDDPTTDEE